MNSLHYNTKLMALIVRLEKEVKTDDVQLRKHIDNMREELRVLANNDKITKGFPRSQQAHYKNIDWKPKIVIKIKTPI